MLRKVLRNAKIKKFNQIKCIFRRVERNLVNLNEPFRFGF